jgi:hypothetical protein
MPISGFGEYTESHWNDVLQILTEAVEIAGLEADLVSNADDVGIIQKRIIQNLYDNPIVVCDVSGKNPNVMFELGMRLAFDKPTIIVKDNQTSYSFDTSPIEHLEYPKDLRFNSIVEFKKTLTGKIQGTLNRASTDKTYTTFLKNFGEFTVAKLEQKEVSGQEFILDELRNMRTLMKRIERDAAIRRADAQKYSPYVESDEVDVCLRNRSAADDEILRQDLRQLPFVGGIKVDARGDHGHLVIKLNPDNPRSRSALDAFLKERNMSSRPGREPIH